MQKHFIVAVVAVLAGLTYSPILRAQGDQSAAVREKLKQRQWNNSPPVKAEYAGKPKAAPAPRRDISGFWDGTAEGGIEAKGALEHVAMVPGHPADDLGGQPDETGIFHPLSYTPAGLAALKKNLPGVGVRAVAAELTNDPVNICDPQGFPRMELYELRVIELAQMKNHVTFTTQFYDNWRVIWTDGRALPNVKDVEPRWNGYSVGKWEDDYTFVVQTVGMDERTWLDNAGRPHTINLQVEERFHRADYDTLELTVTINDPAYYTQPWKALDKFVLHRLPDTFDMEEFFCSPSETADYNKLIGTPDAQPASTK